VTGKQKFGIGVALIVALTVGAQFGTPTTTETAGTPTTTTTTTRRVDTTVNEAVPVGDWDLIWAAWDRLAAEPDPNDGLYTWAVRRANRHFTEELVDSVCDALDEGEDADVVLYALILSALDILQGDGGWTDLEVAQYIGGVAAAAVTICPEYGPAIIDWVDTLGEDF
jgi:hypothetical protein